MTTREQNSDSPPTARDRAPENPQARPEETVDALAPEPEPDAESQQVAAEDVTENPEADNLDGVPGPSPDEPGEPSG